MKIELQCRNCGGKRFFRRGSLHSSHPNPYEKVHWECKRCSCLIDVITYYSGWDKERIKKWKKKKVLKKIRLT